MNVEHIAQYNFNIMNGKDMETHVRDENVTGDVDTETNAPVPHKRRKSKMGRPKGSKNKKTAASIDVNAGEIAPRSRAIYRKFQRSWVKPQFAITRNEAAALLTRFLRSKKGKNVLAAVIADGFKGIDRLSDTQLAAYLQKSSLLSRYPHEVVIGK